MSASVPLVSGVVGAVLLAAGAGSRMGWRPKCLLELAGVPLIHRQLSALAAAQVAPVVVVLGHHAERIDSALQGRAVQRVRNADVQASPASSLRCGLQALPQDVGGVLVVLADQPLIDAQDIRALVAAYLHRPAGTQCVRPVVDGLPGNPVVFSAAVRAQMLACERAISGQQWAQAHPEQVHLWVTPNRHYLTDVDTMADVHTLATLTGHALHWPADLEDPRSGPVPQPNA